MLAIELDGIRNICTIHRSIPEIQDPDDAIVKVTLAGLCGSDLHAYRGHEPFAEPYVMGHEFMGEIVALGSAYSDPARSSRPALYPKLAIGDKVVSPFTSSCSECHFCRIGFTSRCVKSQLFGSRRLPGAQAQYIRVPCAGGTLFYAPDLAPMPSETGLSVNNAALLLLGDVLPTGYFAALQAVNHPNLKTLFQRNHLPFPGNFASLENVLPVQLDADQGRLSVAVIGLGPVGLCALISLVDILVQQSLEFTIYAIEYNKDRIETAHGLVERLIDNKLGEIHFLGPQEVEEMGSTLSSKLHAALEVVGNNSALKLAYQLVRPFGVISSVGVHTSPVLPFNGDDLYDKNVSLSFGRCPVRAIFPLAVDLMTRRPTVFGSVGPGQMIERVVGMGTEAAVQDAYVQFEKGVYGKVVFDPWA